MREKYGDQGFIGIAVHGDDQMDVMGTGRAYEQFAQYYNGFPTAYINRNFMSEETFPDPEELEAVYLEQIDIPAFAEIKGSLVGDENNPRKVTLNTTTKFIEGEEDAFYAIGYTVIEDNVGPYNQENYLSGETGEETYGYGDLPRKVKTFYNDVARNCSKPAGEEESILERTEANKEYEYSTEIELTDVKNLSRYRVVAYVVNLETAAIENSCIITPSWYSGVNSITTEENEFKAISGKGFIRIITDAPASIFTPDGSAVATGLSTTTVNLPAGLYIVTAAGRSAKLIVR